MLVRAGSVSDGNRLASYCGEYGFIKQSIFTAKTPRSQRKTRIPLSEPEASATVCQFPFYICPYFLRLRFRLVGEKRGGVFLCALCELRGESSFLKAFLPRSTLRCKGAGAATSNSPAFKSQTDPHIHSRA